MDSLEEERRNARSPWSRKGGSPRRAIIIEALRGGVLGERGGEGKAVVENGLGELREERWSMRLGLGRGPRANV